MATLLERVKTRLSFPDDEQALVKELLLTACDRIKLRVGILEEEFPSLLNSIAVDVAVKAYRRVEYEGISTEGGSESLSTSFVDDILAEYAEELQGYADAQSSGSGTTGAVKFI